MKHYKQFPGSVGEYVSLGGLMRLIHWYKTYTRWWKTWRALPVFSWVKAAEYYRAGRYLEAARFYYKGIESHPHHPAILNARLDLAYCLFKSGELEEAQEVLRRVISIAPQQREAYMRLATLQQWVGRPIEASWTLRRGKRVLQNDPELVGTLLLCLLEGGVARQRLSEVLDEISSLEHEGMTHQRIQVAKAKYRLLYEDETKGKLDIEVLALEEKASREAVIMYAEVLLSEGKVFQARQQLRRLLQSYSDHPRVHSLFAESYLKSGVFYEPEAAVHHATLGCQLSRWMSARESHILAEAYYHADDHNAALLAASRAREVGAHDKVSYRNLKNLDQLIETLSSEAPSTMV